MQNRKSSWLSLIPALLMVVVAGINISWLASRPKLDALVFAVALVIALDWFFIQWVALHRLTFQIASLWRCRSRDQAPQELPGRPLRFAIFYATCDDLVESCLLSCLSQDYPAEQFGVFVCDDSTAEGSRAAVDRLCAEKGMKPPLRRPPGTGFKAANLNYAYRACAGGSWDWIVIVDADQMLPRTYLRALADDVAGTPPEVCFIQSGQLPEGVLSGQVQTPFQTAMRLERLMLFERDLPWRYEAGFYPFLGHCGAVRSTAWERLGGFPECVSEDMAFTMAAHRKGLRGAPAVKSRSLDGVPKDFPAFVVRLNKYAAGAAELLVRHFPAYLSSRAQFVEKADLGAWLGSYAALPLLFLSIAPTTWLNWRIWNEGLVQLDPTLASAFVGMFLLSFAPLISVSESPWSAVRHWVWSFAIYNAALPVAACSFVVHLFRSPRFQCTPKGTRPSPPHVVAGILTCVAGLSLVALALFCWSPFSLITLSFGLAQVLFPLFRLLHIQLGIAAFLSRLLIWIPGLLFAAGVLLMWLRGS